jgi:hypothetical protein
MIPQRIIQTGPPGVPLMLQAATTATRLLHPEFEYKFFSDSDIEDLIADHFPDYAGIYRSFPYRIQRYDLFRYLAVYQYGGFYLDLDVFLVRPLTALLSQACVFPFEELSAIQYLKDRFQMDWQVGNYAFGAAPGDPFLAAVINNCIRAATDDAWVAPMMKGIPRLFWPHFYVLNTTGPGLVSRTLAEKPDGAGSVSILFPTDVRDPATWHQLGDFGVHHMIGSWRGQPGFMRQRLTRLWDGWTLKRILSDSRSTGATRHVPAAGIVTAQV